MHTSNSDTPPVPGPAAGPALRPFGVAWFLVAATGQAAFIWMILAHYGRKTLAADYAGWNDKPLIKGYVPGDDLGNAMFAVHVLLAAVVTLGGLLQLVPALRRRAPALHRWNGRVFFVVAIVTATGGLWLTWARQTYLSVLSGVAVSVNAVLILGLAAWAWRAAVRRDVAAHRRWALRAFLVVNGVWFLRVGIMAWALASGGLGMNDRLSGPADVVLQFGAYLIPLAVLELYLRAGERGARGTRFAAAGVMVLATLITAIGVVGATLFMWGPYMM